MDLVYPPRCPLCGNAIAAQGGLCIECWPKLETPGEPSCSTCQVPMGAGSGKTEAQCAACQTDPPRHSGIYSAAIYNEASRKLILQFKHGGKIALAKMLGRLMAARLPEPNGDRAPLLVPVPLHRLRLWQRGFNQAALLAREVANNGKGIVLVDGLIRRKRTRSLGGLGRADREKALSGAIAMRPSRRAIIADRDIVLVDDVFTSGATSEACVDALLDGGARSVRVLCFARVVGGAGRQAEPD